MKYSYSGKVLSRLWTLRRLPVLCSLIVSSVLYAEEYVLLRTVIEDQSIRHDRPAGNRHLLTRPSHPASVFKVVILIGLLREGRIRPDERVVVERHISKAPVSIQEATYRSSNLAFTALARRLGAHRLRQEAVRMQFFRSVPPEDFGRSSSVYRGEDLLTDPEHVHRFMISVASGAKLQQPERLHAFLLWPGSCGLQIEAGKRSGTIHAKSGTWAGSIYMTGFCSDHRRTEVVTVFVPYRVPHWRPARTKAIQLFYKQLQARLPDIR